MCLLGVLLKFCGKGHSPSGAHWRGILYLWTRRCTLLQCRSSIRKTCPHSRPVTVMAGQLSGGDVHCLPSAPAAPTSRDSRLMRLLTSSLSTRHCGHYCPMASDEVASTSKEEAASLGASVHQCMRSGQFVRMELLTYRHAHLHPIHGPPLVTRSSGHQCTQTANASL